MERTRLWHGGAPLAAIEVEDLQKSFGTVLALAGISFTVADGETVAVLGPNGAGKTTAMESIEDLKELGKTILLTTHYMDEAQRLADRIVVIAGGRIVADGPPESIGGREHAAARITFRLPAGTSSAELPVRAGFESNAVVRRDGEVVVETSEPTRVLHVLTGWALGRGIEVAGLTVSRPSLEDVYLALTEEPAAEATGDRG